jgi:hypothetical protein
MTAPLPPLAAFEEKASILLEAYTTGSAEAMARLYEYTSHRRFVADVPQLRATRSGPATRRAR